MEFTFLPILLAALVLDWLIGDPPKIWSRVPHPVVLFGKLIAMLDKTLNQDSVEARRRYRYGAVTISVCIVVAICAGLLFQYLIARLGWAGHVLEVLTVSIFLAQRSLHEHVRAVSSGFVSNGLEGARDALRMIVGRDPDLLDQSAICRASIETLAENFSDGVVAPAFWYLIFGLPGLFAYKMINTADSMIGYRDEQYAEFGRVAAQIDDLANWLPARISAFLVGLAAGATRGSLSANRSMSTAFRDAGLHRSPNAGWPESAMAGSLDIALGGPRTYANVIVPQAFLNAAGRRRLGPGDIQSALELFKASCFVLWVIVGMVMLFKA